MLNSRIRFLGRASGAISTPAPLVQGCRNVLLAAMILVPGSTDLAQAQIEAPSAYEELIESPTDVGGVATEADAEVAQAAAGDESGLSPSTRGQIEEIVVQARKREELLEATPVSITAMSENLLPPPHTLDPRDFDSSSAKVTARPIDRYHLLYGRFALAACQLSSRRAHVCD